MSTRAIDAEAVRAKKKAKQVVRRGELAALLSDWARAADHAMGQKVAEMEARLRAELNIPIVDGEYHDVNPNQE